MQTELFLQTYLNEKFYPKKRVEYLFFIFFILVKTSCMERNKVSYVPYTIILNS